PAIGQECRYIAWMGTDYKIYRCQMIAAVPGSASMHIDGVLLSYSDFYRFAVTNGSPIGGHSGAVLYVQLGANLLGVGLAFGGIPGSEIWAFPARRCFERMMQFFRN